MSNQINSLLELRKKEMHIAFVKAMMRKKLEKISIKEDDNEFLKWAPPSRAQESKAKLDIDNLKLMDIEPRAYLLKKKNIRKRF